MTGKAKHAARVFNISSLHPGILTAMSLSTAALREIIQVSYLFTYLFIHSIELFSLSFWRCMGAALVRDLGGVREVKKTEGGGG